jgi:hypothetical protein
MAESASINEPSALHQLQSLFYKCNPCLGSQRKQPCHTLVDILSNNPNSELRIQNSPMDHFSKLPATIRNRIYELCETLPDYNVILIPWHEKPLTRARPRLPPLTQVSRLLRHEALRFYECKQQHSWEIKLNLPTWHMFQIWADAICSRLIFIEKVIIHWKGYISYPSTDWLPDPALPLRQFVLKLDLSPNPGRERRVCEIRDEELLVPKAKWLEAEKTEKFRVTFEDVAGIWAEKRRRGEFRGGDLSDVIEKVVDELVEAMQS